MEGMRNVARPIHEGPGNAFDNLIPELDTNLAIEDKEELIVV